MTWNELEQMLPNGFHDARLDEIAIDYRGRTAVFVLEFWAVEEWPTDRPALIPELYRRGKLTFSGLLACAVDVPNKEYQDANASVLWIDAVPRDSALTFPVSWPLEPLPEGAFRRSFYFLNDADSYVHVAAGSVDFE